MHRKESFGKFQEQDPALQLEKKMSKNQILQDYLNTINLGASSYGVQAAAKRYFNKDVSQLNLSESTVIAGITQNPTLYNPIINPDENAKRRKIILQKMVDQGYISEQQQQDALAVLVRPVGDGPLGQGGGNAGLPQGHLFLWG